MAMAGWTDPESFLNQSESEGEKYFTPVKTWMPIPMAKTEFNNNFENNNENVLFKPVEESFGGDDDIFRNKKSPPFWYVCDLCRTPGHYISDCSTTKIYERRSTPYQGKKRSCGEYKCDKCKRRWFSVHSWANIPQTCKKCHIDSFPYKQFSLKDVREELHDRIKSMQSNDYTISSREMATFERVKRFWTADCGNLASEMPHSRPVSI